MLSTAACNFNTLNNTHSPKSNFTLNFKENLSGLQFRKIKSLQSHFKQFEEKRTHLQNFYSHYVSVIGSAYVYINNEYQNTYTQNTDKLI